METWGQLGRNHMGSAPARGRHDALFYSNSQIPLVYTSSKSAGRYQLRQPARGGPPPWRAARAPASIQSCIRARRTPSTPTGRAWPCLWRRATGQLVLQPRRLTLQTLQKNVHLSIRKIRERVHSLLGGAFVTSQGLINSKCLCDFLIQDSKGEILRNAENRFSSEGDSNVPKILFKRKLKCFKIRC